MKLTYNETYDVLMEFHKSSLEYWISQQTDTMTDEDIMKRAITDIESLKYNPLSVDKELLDDDAKSVFLDRESAIDELPSIDYSFMSRDDTKLILEEFFEDCLVYWHTQPQVPIIEKYERSLNDVRLIESNPLVPSGKLLHRRVKEEFIKKIEREMMEL